MAFLSGGRREAKSQEGVMRRVYHVCVILRLYHDKGMSSQGCVMIEACHRVCNDMTGICHIVS